MEAAATLPARKPVAGQPSRAPSANASITALVDRYQPRLFRLGVLLSYLAVSLVLYLGWVNRHARVLTAESGLGYALGIVGGGMMLMLLLYPLRKKARFMRRLGPVKYWFRLHMTFGVLGPVCILYHCEFQLGSMNSNVALFCMLTVAGSGLVGRYLYMRIHNGLYGSRLTLDELRRDATALREDLAGRADFAPRMLESLDAFESRTLAGGRSPLPLGLRAWRLHARLIRELHAEIRARIAAGSLTRAEARDLYRSLRRHLRARLEILRRIAGLARYERLFSFWHLLHFPLFLMLVLSGTVHVFAVHIY